MADPIDCPWLHVCREASKIRGDAYSAFMHAQAAHAGVMLKARGGAALPEAIE